jgi:hypothetical protein
MSFDDDFRAPAAFAFLMVMAILAAIELMPPVLRKVSQYSERVQMTPAVKIYNNRNEIYASPRLSGYFPIRGFDYDKDGNLDYVERFYHGYPRIPYGSWHEVKHSDSLFREIQEEYRNTLIT